MKKVLTLSISLVFISLLSVPTLAHHSFAMFDQTQKVTIQGTVADVQWTNPHVWIEVNVENDNGEIELWGVEFTSRVHLTRRGFPRNNIGPGDEVEFVLSPYVDGRPGGRFYTVKFANGEYYRDPGARRAFEQSQAALQE
jgi:hypothetical protein